jgi:hypothetical protein
MPTEKQIEANKRNALRSTGPATVAGRSISSRNAWKHGLTAREVTVDEAERTKFSAFRDDIVADLAPEGALEEELVEEIAICSWRLRRVYRLEVNHSDSNPLLRLLSPPPEVAIDPGGHLLRSFDLSSASLIRYETSIARLRERALHALERLQARRRGEAVQAPIAVDVTHSVEVGSELEHTVRGGRLKIGGRVSGDRDSTPEGSHAAPIKRIGLAKQG